MQRLVILFLLLTAFTRCTIKETIYEKDHQDILVEGNTPPPYEGVTTTQIHSFINKMYIDLLGREALQAELEEATLALRAGNLDPDAREDLMMDIMSQPEYDTRFWERYSGQVLKGATLAQIYEQIFILGLLVQQATMDGNIDLAQRLQFEVDKLQALYDAPDAYAGGLIDIREFMRRLAFNLIYDEINMGSENFVLASFENFFKRYPTEAEQAAGITMVDGLPAQILFQDGNSKYDLLIILTESPEFLQGLAIDIYQQLLSREPSPEEMGEAVLEFTDNPDYQAVQRMVMLTEEYAGF